MARWTKLGIVAGGGVLPAEIARACSARGEPFHVVRLKGFADPGLSSFPGDDCGLAEIGKLLSLLKGSGCDSVVLAGVVQRPDFRQLTPDWRGVVILPKVLAAASRGDGPLLQVLVDALEAEGLFVVGADEATSDLSAPRGALGRFSPSEADFEDISKAASVVSALGALDIGQAAVVADGLVLAVEAAEGTDAMLRRCASLSSTLKGGDNPNGVLVKRPKPGQELRVDLPTIGVETVRLAYDAGLAGIAVEAGAALIIDRDIVKASADELGLFVYGFSDEELKKT